MLIKDTLDAIDSSKVYSIWVRVFRVTVFCVFAFLTFIIFSTLYIGALYRYVYKITAIVLICTYVFFRRLRDGIEFKLIFVYCVWLVVVRIYDGGIFVEGTKDYIVNQGIILPLLGFALLVPDEKRLKWLDVMAIIYCIGYTVVGLICIYGVISHTEIMNPLENGILLCMLGSNGRLHVFSNSSNTAAAWYAMACTFLPYLFFRYRKPLSRVLIVFAFVACYLVLALTYSRSCMLAFSISLAMVVALALYQRFNIHKTAHKALVLVLAMCICAPLAYKSFSVSTSLVSDATTAVLERRLEKIYQQAPAAESGDSSPAQQAESESVKQMEHDVRWVKRYDEINNNRGTDNSGRLEIWIAALMSLRDDPDRIFTGSINSMDITNQITQPDMSPEEAIKNGLPHHHNTYLELLMYGGLPGFLLMMAVLIIIVVKSVRLFFAENDKATPAIKSLPAILAGIMVYNMLETSLIHKDYMCTAIYFIVAGYILVYEREFCGRKTA